MGLCAQPLNHIQTDQLGECVGEGSRKLWKWKYSGDESSDEWCVGHSSRYLLVKVTHPLKSYPMAKAIVLGFIL